MNVFPLKKEHPSFAKWVYFHGKTSCFPKQNKLFSQTKQVIFPHEKYGHKKIPTATKDYRETPQVGVDGFEPPTLCL